MVEEKKKNMLWTKWYDAAVVRNVARCDPS